MRWNVCWPPASGRWLLRADLRRADGRQKAYLFSGVSTHWSAKKVLITAAGWLAFALGWVGVFVPGMPTTIFWILAAIAFLRVNPRMYQKIISNPRFGAAIRLFIEEGRISRRGKLISISAMLLFGGMSVFIVPPLWVKLVIAAAVLGGATWVALLPTADIKKASTGPGQVPRSTE
jgi:uncharacterized membrane protein YbaN (DUF454 family)